MDDDRYRNKSTYYVIQALSIKYFHDLSSSQLMVLLETLSNLQLSLATILIKSPSSLGLGGVLKCYAGYHFLLQFV